MSIKDLPPSKVVHADDGALSYLIKPEGSSGMGLVVTINPDGSSIYHPIDPRIQGFSLDSEASKMLYEVLHFHKENGQGEQYNTFHLAV